MRYSICCYVLLFLACGDHSAFSQQQESELEWRVQKLEKYVETFHPTIKELSNNLNKSIQEYTKDLESSLENYSQKLQINLDERLNNIDRKIVILNPYSKSYQSIETNTGMFLISVGKVEPLEAGVRLHLNIGNPNYADYQNFQLKLIWGSKWTGGFTTTYEQWRQSLNGAEYTFQGKLEKGKWNTVTVDLSPTDGGRLEYIECEMEVSSVELEFN
jgi:hypothetical protein